jgi:hypothetical protein
MTNRKRRRQSAPSPFHAAPIRTCWPAKVNGWGLTTQSHNQHLALAPPWRGLFFVEPIPASRIALLRNPHFRAHEVSLCARPRPLQSEGDAFLCHEIAVIGGRVWSGHQPTRGQVMKRLTSAVPPKRARNSKARLEHAKLIVASARERAAVAAQRYEEEWRKKKWR